MTPLVQAEGLVKRFRAVTALDRLDLTVPSGVVTAVLGPNGAGKTTLIRTVATLLTPDAGALSVLGVDVARRPAEIRRMIGLAGQSAAVEATMTGRENLYMVARLYGQSRRAAASSTRDVLDLIGMGDIADRAVKTYSGGQRRRIDLGASLVGSPRLLLLDEPTTGLDPRSRSELWEAIRGLGRSGTEILLTTQYLDEADQLAGRIVIIDAGRVVAEGTPGELKSMTGTDRIEAHVRDATDIETAAGVMARLAGAEAEVDPATRRCTVSCTYGAAVLAAVAVALVEAGVIIDDLTLRRPTLDEVFLALTGTAHSDDQMEGAMA